MNPTRTWAATALLALSLTACGGPAASPDATGAADEDAPSTAAATAADSFGVTDPWVKAATADDGMTAVFGEITNGSDAEVTIVSASHDAADTVELHEVVTEGADSTMREKDGGFVVPAGGGLPLEPGADHIMLMDLTRDLEPGDETTVTVEFSDGSTAEFTAPVKEYAGANEEYEGGGHGDGGH
ncbi:MULTISPECIES: copper chaperone PCu(A)C [Nocardiopsidaceae]|uniref:Copper chaperone PCu(A)C n=2 Tax=Nocardiopsidaceae TaxID=83676 RepID=A0ABY6YQX2_9ACTN|nr:copper chaperone PCu(A)C [Streptomonospora nanhaiensis]WAE74683.1 copper chaperone PCu(A)C [Streptomonospora nanhaiensis]